MAHSDRDLVELTKAIGVTAELVGAELSAPATKAMITDLADFAPAQVLAALSRCRRECRGRFLSLGDVLDRIDDGHPGPEEAWALIPITSDGHPDEHASTVWTAAIAESFGVALPLLKAGMVIEARMAFKEAYAKIVARERESKTPVRWFASLGRSVPGREQALRNALDKKRLSSAYVSAMLPAPEAVSAVPLLEASLRSPMPESFHLQLRAALKA